MRLDYWLCLCLFSSSLSGVIDFKNNVWPILEERCIECHRAPYERNGVIKKPKAGLRLDGAAHIMYGSDESPVVVVDHPSRSSLYQRVILSPDDSDHMPPKGEPLTKSQKEILRMWIAQGVDFGSWVGATDGIQDLTERRKADQVLQATYLKEFDVLAEGVVAVEGNFVKEIALSTGLMIRPLGEGSKLLEARVVTEPSQVGDNSVRKLLSLKDNLVSLDLRNTNVTDDSLKIISSFPRLKKLNLMGTQINSDGLGSLNRHKNLETLNLVNTSVTDEATDILISMPLLRRVYLWKSAFTKQGILTLKKEMGDLIVSY
ncbi:MAG: hypothetical protein ISQ76_00985 [Opitutales bacterium]|nr:hypothetical protein [Opitutales bacterium]